MRSYKWSPDIIDNLFVDDYDYKGLIYLYNDIKDQVEDIKGKK